MRTLWSKASTRLIIQCSGPTAYRLRRAAGNPPQITLDLPEARLPPGGFKPLAMEQGPVRLIQAVRTGQGVRLLLETRQESSASVFPLLDPYRLILDVNDESRPRRAAAPPAEARRQRRVPTSVALAGAPAPPPAASPAVAATISVAAETPRPPAPPISVALAATPTAVPATARPTPTPAPEAAPHPRRRVRVVIDPGHGGKDPGAPGGDGIWEKDVVLAVGRRLADKLRATGEFDVAMTRDSDVFLALEERTAFANAHDADLFISIHCNASPNRHTAGMETYYLNNTNDRGTLRLARMENGFAAATGRRADGTDVTFILSDLVQSYKVDESVELAHALQSAAVESVHRDFPSLRDIGVKKGPFYVLVGAAMPSVLVETSFLTNPREGALLATKAYQERIAEGLLRGLQRFVENSRDARTL